MIEPAVPNPQASPTVIRELDWRASDGIDVTLLWNSRTDQVFVAVIDKRAGRAFRFDVSAADAREAFQHPYAFAPPVHDVRLAA